MLPIEPPALLDERGDPNFRHAFVAMAARSRELDVAITRIRLAGLDLTQTELGHVRRIRLLIRDVRADRLRAEAEALAVRRGGDRSLRFFLDLMERKALSVRAAPLGGWSPDFTVFQGAQGSTAILLGNHWLRRPEMLHGPVFASLHGVLAAKEAGARFETLWAGAYDVSEALGGVLRPIAVGSGG